MRRQIKVVPGTHPTPDSTALNTVHYTLTDKVYFRGQDLRKLPGWVGITDTGTPYKGASRTIYSYFDGDTNIYIIGTHSGLYARIGSAEYNITPLKTVAAITLPNDPLAFVLADATMTVTYAAHGLAIGDRIRIAGATHTTGGFATAYINIEHIVATVPSVNSLTIELATTAPATDATEGGAGVEVYKQITAGNIDQGLLIGFGGGAFGATGVPFGSSLTFASGYTYPRIWSADRYANDVILCPGDDGDIYSWDSNTAIAPVKVAGSPTANWIYVKNNAIHALGAGGILNNLQKSDITDLTDWTPAPASYAFEDALEGAGRFISQANSRDISLLFTEGEVWAEEFVDKPDLYIQKRIMATDGLIAPRARSEVEDSVYWMGAGNFYLFDGANIQQVEGITCRDYIYKNLNYGQRSKVFSTYDPDLKHWKVHFPTGDSNEPNEYMIYDVVEKHSTLGTIDRTAGEDPFILGQLPMYAFGDGVTANLYFHGTGTDDAGAAMLAYAESYWNVLGGAGKCYEIMEIYPDTTQTGNITLTLTTKDYAQSMNQFSWENTITPTTEFIDPQAEGALIKYRWESNEMGGDFRIGAWSEEIQPGTSS